MNDSGEENNYVSENSEIISSKNVSSRGLLHPLRGSPLPEGAKGATSPNVYLNRPINPNLNTSPSENTPGGNQGVFLFHPKSFRPQKAFHIGHLRETDLHLLILQKPQKYFLSRDLS